MNNLSGSSGGRSSSQISIYDYPEHLNPFYEDENHKRLRFWNLNTLNKNKNKTTRRNSFSLDGIKDIWAFKSFRLNKKKSSTLGINKTSESPPPLRRTLEPSNTNYATYDSRQRHTVGIGLNNNNNNFQRNSGYRSSLQDVTTVREDNNNGFLRNNRYRGTLQNTDRYGDQNHYLSSASVTPLSIQRNIVGMTPGSSQSSLNSTNPFEDDDDENIAINKIKKPARKKRRAPQPPGMVPKIINNEETHNNNNINNDEDKSIEFSNLTKEIESFVKNTTTDDNNLERKSDNIIIVEETKTNTNSKNSKVKIITETDNNLIINKDKSTVPIDVKIVIVEDNSDLSTIQEHPTVTVTTSAITTETITKTTTVTSIPSKSTTVTSLSTKSSSSIERNENELKIKPQLVTTETVEVKPQLEQQNVREVIYIVDVCSNTKQQPEPIIIARTGSESQLGVTPEPKSPISHEVENILEAETPGYKSSRSSATNFPKFTDLKITESLDNLDKSNQSLNRSPNETSKTIKTENYEFRVRYVPLRDDSTRLSQSSDEQDKHEQTITELNKAPIPIKRKSVKEIIESINRSQRLLKVNQELLELQDNQISEITSSSDNLTKNLKKLEDDEKKIDTFLNDINKNNDKEINNKRESYYDNIPVMVEEFEELTNNNKIVESTFEKCTIRPHNTTNNLNINNNNNDKDTKIEWNPVPKPRRSRNFSTEDV